MNFIVLQFNAPLHLTCIKCHVIANRANTKLSGTTAEKYNVLDLDVSFLGLVDFIQELCTVICRKVAPEQKQMTVVINFSVTGLIW